MILLDYLMQMIEQLVKVLSRILFIKTGNCEELVNFIKNTGKLL
jgi:hypothetical protein